MDDQDTVGKVADATKAVAETGGQLIEAATNVGQLMSGPFREAFGIVEDSLKFVRLQRQMARQTKALNLECEAIMKQRGLSGLTREPPLNFAVPLLTKAILEQDKDG